MDIAEQFANIWFTHECVLLSGANESPYGGAGERVPFMGRVSQSTQRVDSATGQELVTDTTVTCRQSVEVVIGDEVELPQPFKGTWEVTAISSHDGIDGMHPDHRKLSLTIAGGTTDTDTGGGGGGIYG